ncbi:MAG TPA: glycosyl hydrolase 53 family protein [Mobilitalea sp.]|nr:glycosyl hydrolase 53 family protein [Mobilitalea sp.]
MQKVFQKLVSIGMISILLLSGCGKSQTLESKDQEGDNMNGTTNNEVEVTLNTTAEVTPTNAAAADEADNTKLPIEFSPVTYQGKVINNGNFIKGVDISSVIALEAAGVKYYNTAGQEEDIFQIFKDAGINYVRVRVWNDPYLSTAKVKTPQNSYGGGICDVNYAVEIGKRCTAVGMSLYIDFHYSDFWSDPGRAYAPKAWANMNLDEKSKALYDFTTQSLNTIKASGVTIGIVGVGNETTNFMSGEKGIHNYVKLIKSGAEAVRAFDPNILVAVHFTNPESHNYLHNYADILNEGGVDYDIFASSYYPIWHGTIENMQKQLNAVAQKYGKLTMIAEYSYYHSGNVSAELQKTFGPADEKGQTNAIIVINKAASEIANCIGTFYWEPAWINADKSTWATMGTGWITQNAVEYDLSNASITEAKGSDCTNQTLFDASGKPLYAITSEVFNRIWKDRQ